MKNKITNIFLISIFFLILLFPTIYTKFNIRTPFIINENRSLQKAPKVHLDDINNYPQTFEKYYGDNYGFRQELILANQKIIDDLLDVDSISSKVLVGQNNWLYTTEYGALKDYQGILKYNDDLLQKLLDLLIGEYREAQKNNIKYIFTVVPDKHTVYPEHLPEAIKKNKTDGNTLLDQLIIKIKEIEPNFPFLDLRDAMLEAKKNNMIYQQTDTHWNVLGAYYGYRAIMDYLGEKALSLDNFYQKDRITDYGNLASMINKKIEYSDYYLEYKNNLEFELIKNSDTKVTFENDWGLPLEKADGRHSLFEYRNDNGNLPNLLMFRDSYTDHLKKFLPNHFSQSIFIWLYPCDIKFDLAKKQGVDIVVRQVAETRVGLQILRCE